jgi:hypothetical protein
LERGRLESPLDADIGTFLLAGCYAVLSVEELLAVLDQPVLESLLPRGAETEELPAETTVRLGLGRPNSLSPNVCPQSANLPPFGGRGDYVRRCSVPYLLGFEQRTLARQQSSRARLATEILASVSEAATVPRGPCLPPARPSG